MAALFVSRSLTSYQLPQKGLAGRDGDPVAFEPILAQVEQPGRFACAARTEQKEAAVRTP